MTIVMLLCSKAFAQQSVLPADFIQSAEKIFQNNVGSFHVHDGEFEAHITAPTPSPWHAQIKAKSIASAKAGDVLIVKLDVRATAKDPSTHAAAVMVLAQQAQGTFELDEELVVLATGQWTTHELPLRLKHNYLAGEMQLALNFGVCRQQVQVRNVSAVNIGPRENKKGLRKPPVTYEGREPGAPWRAAAAQRIEKIRKADLRLRVLDATGKPLANAKVQYRLRRHEFPFGTAIVTDRVLGESPDDQKYREILKAYFNSAVFENDMKWPHWVADGGGDARAHQAKVDAAVDWLREYNFEVRGHCVVWPEAQRMPKRVSELVANKDVAGTKRAIAAHAADIVGRFAGRVGEWDVVNEPIPNPALQNIGGVELLASSFHDAAKADPSARLYLNDYMFLSNGALNGGRIDQLYDLLKAVKDSGAPMHAIGEQGHFQEVLVSPVRMIELLDRFSTLGLPIRITEFDVATEDEQLQADYLRDFLTVAFSHENVNGFLFWGFWQKHHWRPTAALWRDDWTRKPIADVYIELTSKQWHTAGEATTDENGEVSIRGFRGDYEAAVVTGGNTITSTFKIGPAASFDLRLK